MEASKRPYNINVGVLGHVDSGKTSLVAALSTTLSTAALDKHPQSKERGITLDLGFSSFTIQANDEIKALGYDEIQFTLVDCPGHASLLKTVVGGAQIMDMMILVVDVTKGIQTQTAECIVLGEITTSHLVVVLNKIDLLDPEKKEKYIKKAKKLVSSTLSATKFSKCPMVAVTSKRNDDSDHNTNGDVDDGMIEIKQLLEKEVISILKERSIHNNNNNQHPTKISSTHKNETPFLFYIDHCFAIKGQGTVLTGTVARGSVSVNDTIELPALKQQKKVKSMQMFRKPINKAHQGDRLGICVTQFDASLIERGLACSPASIPTFSAAIALVEKVRFYAGDVISNSKIHVIVGHHTTMAKMIFFGTPRSDDMISDMVVKKLHINNDNSSSSSDDASFDFNREYLYQDALYGDGGRPRDAEYASSALIHHQNMHNDDEEQPHHGLQWAYLVFDTPITAPTNSLIIGARLDADLNTSSCRIAFHGHLCSIIDPSDAQSVQKMRVYKVKGREGVIERIENDGCTAICRGMFSKDSDLTKFIDMKVLGPENQIGVLESKFGKSGKFKVRFSHPITMNDTSGGDGNNGITLMYKRFIFDSDKKKITQ